MVTLKSSHIPNRLAAVASPPKQLFVEGNLSELLDKPCIAIVGSRKVSPYGREVTKRLARELAEQGIVIVSGLAFGVDAIAHEATLEAGGQAIAVLPSPLDNIYPASHHGLARRILERSGALVTEYPSGTKSFKGNFVARNRIIAGLADAVLITEAALKSGSLHTARFALNAGRDVLAVPGNITSPTSEGTNNLIRSGAVPVTEVSDILFALGIEPSKTNHTPKGASMAEQSIIDLIAAGTTDGSLIQAASGLTAEDFNQTLTMLELNGKIRSLGSNHWGLS
jgi:DNA processing protein